MRTEERMTLQNAAEALGISEQTARRWIKVGKLKAYKPGLRYLIPASAVEELLEEEAPKAPGPARQPEHDGAPAGPATGWEASQATGELLLKSWEEELRRWDEKFPTDKIPGVFDYGKLVGWAHGVVRVIQYHEIVARRDLDSAQRGEVADMLGRMEDAKRATLRVVERVFESVKTNAAFREILGTSDILFSSNNAENDG